MGYKDIMVTGLSPVFTITTPHFVEIKSLNGRGVPDVWLLEKDGAQFLLPTSDAARSCIMQVGRKLSEFCIKDTVHDALKSLPTFRPTEGNTLVSWHSIQQESTSVGHVLPSLPTCSENSVGQSAKPSGGRTPLHDASSIDGLSADGSSGDDDDEKKKRERLRKVNEEKKKATEEMRTMTANISSSLAGIKDVFADEMDNAIPGFHEQVTLLKHDMEDMKSSMKTNQKKTNDVLLPDFDAFLPSTPNHGRHEKLDGDKPEVTNDVLLPDFDAFLPLYPLYSSSICQHSPATTLSSLQSTPSTLPSLNNTPTLQQIQSNGTMPSSSGASLDTRCQGFQRLPLRRRAQIFKSLPSDLDTSFTRSLFTKSPPTEKVLLLDQEQVSEWDIIVNPNGLVDDINDGSRRFLQLVKAMATPYSEQSERKFKTSLSMAIVEFVCAYGGRFVDMDDSGRCTLLTKAKAREKTSQALREMKVSMWTTVGGTDFWKVANVTPTERMPKMSEGRIHIDGHPGKWDVICGRGGGGNHHEGNRRFRGLIEQFKVPYHYEGEEFHGERMGKRKELLRSAIVDYVKSNGGRFVEISNHRGSTFEVVGDGIFWFRPFAIFKVEDGRLVEEGQLVEDDRFVKNRNYINWDGDFAFDVSEVVEAEVVHAFTNEK
jgi:hypothetical protein